MDERLRAFDKETGEIVWEFQLNAGGYATPAIYEINGKQYLVIAAGGGGKPETAPGDAYYCFSLPE
jgi:quinoprotein glucose dehydrogenase